MQSTDFPSSLPGFHWGIGKEDRFPDDKALGLMLVELNDLPGERSTNISEWSTSVPHP